MGRWDFNNTGEADFAAVMLNEDGVEVWRWQVSCRPRRQNDVAHVGEHRLWPEVVQIWIDLYPPPLT